MTTPREQRCETLISLREYLEARMDAQQRAIDTAGHIMDQRLTTSKEVLDHRLDGLNALRENVLSKGEFAAQHGLLMSEFRSEAAALRAEIAGLKEWRAEQAGKASVTSVYISYVLSALAIVIAAMTLMTDLLR